MLARILHGNRRLRTFDDQLGSSSAIRFRSAQLPVSLSNGLVPLSRCCCRHRLSEVPLTPCWRQNRAAFLRHILSSPGVHHKELPSTDICRFWSSPDG